MKNTLSRMKPGWILVIELFLFELKRLYLFISRLWEDGREWGHDDLKMLGQNEPGFFITKLNKIYNG